VSRVHDWEPGRIGAFLLSAALLYPSVGTSADSQQIESERTEAISLVLKDERLRVQSSLSADRIERVYYASTEEYGPFLFAFNRVASICSVRSALRREKHRNVPRFFRLCPPNNIFHTLPPGPNEPPVVSVYTRDNRNIMCGHFPFVRKRALPEKGASVAAFFVNKVTQKHAVCLPGPALD
jgi:hypothetical protein